MEVKVNTSIDGTPLLMEMFKTQAYIKALAAFLLNEKQLDEFHDRFMKNLKRSMLDFMEDHPGSIQGEEELKASLFKRFGLDHNLKPQR